MKCFLIATSEMRSARFDRLCDHLEADTPADRAMAFGRLMIWYARWGADAEYDHGLLFDCTEKRMGIWAEHPEPLRFGRALALARYIVPMDSVYPPALVAGRTGFVALAADGGAMLDQSWSAWHRKAPGKERLAFFLTDFEQRQRAFLSLALDPSAAARAMGMDADALQGWIGRPPAQATGDPPAGEPMPPPGRPQGAAGADSGRPMGGLPPPRTPAPATENVKTVQTEREKQPYRNVQTETDKPRTGPNGVRTGEPKTADMFAYLMEQKREDWPDLLCALERLDRSDNAMTRWQRAISTNPGFVREQLNAMTETPERWDGIYRPAAWMASRLEPIAKGKKRSTT